jgi:beta-lactamase superfamily II metal-dependent hydrolase
MTRLNRILVSLLAISAFLLGMDPASAQKAVKVGKKLPAWEAGYLDIHFINTCTGEASFIIMPDGTQMLVDVGGAVMDDELALVPIPDQSKRPGEWINRYIAACKRWTKNPMIDYLSITHLHGDHIGTMYPEAPMSFKGNWRSTSLADIIDNNKVGKLVDRTYPNYDYPSYTRDNKHLANYIKCIKWHAATDGMKIERFVPGSADQFVLKYNPEAYPSFKIQNIAANGVVWTGKDMDTVCAFPDTSAFVGKGKEKDNSPSENSLSTVFKITYGDFDYYAGGDVSHNGSQYFAWKDVESPIADVVGCVDVMKANHHGCWDANNDYFLEKLSPLSIILTVWRTTQPTGGIEKYFSPKVNGGNADLYITHLEPETEEKLKDYMPRVSSKDGHLVVRVNPDGKTYNIYILDESNISMTIQKTFGPFYSR